MKLKLDNKGVSLALTIGLLLLLITITTTINELVIRALRASHQIEASDKAYFAAEAGVENALYELSIHTAGYETAALGSRGVRNDKFTVSGVQWTNEWEIANTGLNDCSDVIGWTALDYCGRIYEGGKLVLNLFSDDAVSGGILTNEINEASTVIKTLDVSAVRIRFRLPPSLVIANMEAFSDGLQALKIDNDGDYVAGETTLNEDGHADYGFPLNTCPYSGGVQVSDNDCDGREDEDSPQDPVLLWKLVDDQGNFFQPLRGCKTDVIPHPSHGIAGANSTLCEKDFIRSGSEVLAQLNFADKGITQSGGPPITFQQFLSSYPFGSDASLRLEILLVAPLVAIDGVNRKKVFIPYLEYGMNYIEASGKLIPSTFFSIKSDGYYQDFKQSITTNVMPRTTSRLLDLTIIQQ